MADEYTTLLLTSKASSINHPGGGHASGLPGPPARSASKLKDALVTLYGYDEVVAALPDHLDFLLLAIGEPESEQSSGSVGSTKSSRSKALSLSTDV